MCYLVGVKNKPTSLRLDGAIAARLDRVSGETGITKTRILEVSIKRILDDYERRGPVALVPSADERAAKKLDEGTGQRQQTPADKEVRNRGKANTVRDHAA